MRFSPWRLSSASARCKRVLRAQNPSLRWVKAAPFPEPEEELYGVSVNGKMYVIGGFASNGKPAAAMVYEYDPGPDKWTKKKSIPVPGPSPGADRPQREDLYLRRLPAAADRSRRRRMGAGR